MKPYRTDKKKTKSLEPVWKPPKTMGVGRWFCFAASMLNNHLDKGSQKTFHVLDHVLFLLGDGRIPSSTFPETNMTAFFKSKLIFQALDF